MSNNTDYSRLLDGNALLAVKAWVEAKGYGTVKSIKVGNTSYSPSSGVVSLPAYPTTLPASDVYAWAKAATKPSYSANEISGVLPTLNAPRSNLGDPTIYETGIIDSEFTNKLMGYAPSNVKIYRSSDGSTLTEATEYTDDHKKALLVGDSTTSLSVPAGNYLVIEITSASYVYLSLLYLYNSTSGTKFEYKIEKSYDKSSWTTVVDYGTQQSTWPGHTVIRHSNIPFRQNGTQGTHFGYVRVWIKCTTTSTTYKTGYIYKLQWWGGYPSGTRNYYTVDYNKNFTFPAGVSATSFTENGTALSSKYAAYSHTHNYAGSSSAGGAATSANKLNTNAGSGTNPVYFSSGVPVACTYSLNKTVPADAVFTDTNYYPTRSYSTGLQISTSTNVTNTCALYVPYATASQYGVVKPAAVRTSAITSTTGGTTSGRYYGVEMDSDGKLFVNVPWSSGGTAYYANQYNDTYYLSNNSGASLYTDDQAVSLHAGQANLMEIGWPGLDSDTTKKSLLLVGNRVDLVLTDNYQYYIKGLSIDMYDDDYYTLHIRANAYSDMYGTVSSENTENISVHANAFCIEPNSINSAVTYRKYVNLGVVMHNITYTFSSSVLLKINIRGGSPSDSAVTSYANLCGLIYRAGHTSAATCLVCSGRYSSYSYVVLGVYATAYNSGLYLVYCTTSNNTVSILSIASGTVTDTLSFSLVP